MSARNVLAHRPELNDFLFAAIGEERNGMELTVVSALGRLGLDPWTEADRFSAMSRAAAAQLLAPMLARLPEGLWLVADAPAIAGRLVKLLPATAALTAAPDARNAVPMATWLLGAALLLALVLTIAMGRDFSPGKLFGASPTGISSTDDPQPRER